MFSKRAWKQLLIAGAIAILLSALSAQVIGQGAQKGDILHIYAKELAAKKSDLNIPQDIYDGLAKEGYPFMDIANAYYLSILLDSSPLSLLKFKPAETPWPDFAAGLIVYKKQRQLMTQIDASGGFGNWVVETSTGPVTVTSKHDVLVAWAKADPGMVGQMKTAGLAEEDILSLRAYALIRSVTDGQLAFGLSQTGDRAQWKASITSLRTQLEALVGLV